MVALKSFIRLFGSSTGMLNIQNETSTQFQAVQILKDWLLSDEHFTHPYPTTSDQAQLMQMTGIGKKQLKNWFTNARRRIWKPLIKKQLDDNKAAAARGGPPPNHERVAAVANAARAAGITKDGDYSDNLVSVGRSPGAGGAKRGGGRTGKQAGGNLAAGGRGNYGGSGSGGNAPPPPLPLTSYGRQDFGRSYGSGKGSAGGAGGAGWWPPNGGSGEGESHGGGGGGSGGPPPPKGALHSVQSSLSFTSGMPRAPSVGQIGKHMKKVRDAVKS
jgi:hypothetical protein